MKRLGELDFPDRMSGYLPAWASQIVFAIFALAAAASLRLVVEHFWPGAGPFALTFPAVLVATLFARWQAGVLALALLILGAWYFVLPDRMSFHLANPSDGPRIIVNTLSGLGIVAVAEVFRRAVRRAVDERDARIVEHDLLLREIDHRVRNNFAAVAGLLDTQRRRAEDAPTKEELTEALGRIDSIARAHNALYRDTSTIGALNFKAYAEELCDALASALFLHGSIRLACDVEPVMLARDKAVSLGLLINELVTNSAKHAFDGRDTGTILVSFGGNGEGYRLVVADNGNGMSQKSRGHGGLGMRLVAAFVEDANGTLSVESGELGTAFAIDLAA